MKGIPGRVIIELTTGKSGTWVATVTFPRERSELGELANAIIQELLRLSPGILIRSAQEEAGNKLTEESRRRGGPIGVPEEQKRQIVKEWLQVRGKVNQEVYARDHGISVSTLRRWTREMTGRTRL